MKYILAPILLMVFLFPSLALSEEVEDVEEMQVEGETTESILSKWEKRELIYDEAIKKCSDYIGKVSVVYTGNNLNLECFEKELSVHSYAKPRILSSNDIEGKLDNSKVKLMEIKSVFDICSGEGTNYCRDNIILDG